MRKQFIHNVIRYGIILILLLTTNTIGAQSSMTDQEVIKYIMQEHEKGTSQAQIVTKLIQRGVDAGQIRRVTEKYKKMAKQGSMAELGGDNKVTDDTRLRTRTGKNGTPVQIREDYGKQVAKDASDYSNYRLKGQSKGKYYHTYDEDDEEFMDMQNDLFEIIPDSMQMLERLLQERKEKLNKVFGRDIFNNEELSFEPNMNIATPQKYKLGPGDAVFVDIYGASQKTFECTISPEGEIVIEGFGPIQVGGLTVSQANALLKKTVGSRYQSSKVKLSVGQTRTISVHVMGEVKTPGTYTLSAFATVFHALYMAGGINDLGTLRNIQVFRDDKLITTVDIYDYILNGKLSGNIHLTDDDVIQVGPYDCLVNIRGKIKRPMFYEMKKEESLSTILKYSGGFTGDAYTKSVSVNRKNGRQYAAYNVEEFDFTNFKIADGDSITVDSIIPRYENTVEIKGAVFHPGMFNINSNVNSVKTLIEHAEGLKEEAFTGRAIMHRLKQDRTLEMISIDVEGIMSGKVADIPLKENDVIFIATKNEKQTERTISITGEVNFPGTYKYAENETLEDFVIQAGGLTDDASTVKVNVARRVSDPKAERPDSVIAQTFSLSLKDGLKIDGQPSFVLMPFDEVSIFKSPGTITQQNVTIEGEVIFAGTYTLAKRNARLSDLIKECGGPNDMAYIKGARLERKTNEAERTRMYAAYKMAQEQQQKKMLELAATSNNASSLASIAEKNQTAELAKFQVPETYPVGIELDKAIAQPGSDADIVLREGDKLIIPRYNGTVKINGSVMYPNTVAYQKGKSVKYYIDAAGGFANDAKKNNTYIIYMNGMVDKIGYGDKIQPGCEIVVPSKTTTKMSLAEKLSMGTGMASIAAMIATIANQSK